MMRTGLRGASAAAARRERRGQLRRTALFVDDIRMESHSAALQRAAERRRSRSHSVETTRSMRTICCLAGAPAGKNAVSLVSIPSSQHPLVFTCPRLHGRRLPASSFPGADNLLRPPSAAPIAHCRRLR